MSGDELLSQPVHETLYDPTGNVLHMAEECGGAHLLKKLQEKFGTQE